MRPALFLAIALLAMPATLAAQQRAPSVNQAPTSVPADAPERATAAPERGTRSLMGMVMGALIASAEKAAEDQANERRALDEPAMDEPQIEVDDHTPNNQLAHGTRDEVAVHSEGQGTP